MGLQIALAQLCNIKNPLLFIRRTKVIKKRNTLTFYDRRKYIKNIIKIFIKMKVNSKVNF